MGNKKQRYLRNFRTVRYAANKYEKETGVRLSLNVSPRKIATIISGSEQELGKSEAWNFLIDYTEGKQSSIRIKDRKNNVGYSRDAAVAFYNSTQWRSLRVLIIEEQKGRCQMCGRSYKDHGVVIHVDHIIPLSIDWSRRLDKGNLQLLCEDCNLGKSNVYSTDWRAK